MKEEVAAHQGLRTEGAHNPGGVGAVEVLHLGAGEVEVVGESQHGQGEEEAVEGVADRHQVGEEAVAVEVEVLLRLVVVVEVVLQLLLGLQQSADTIQKCQ